MKFFKNPEDEQHEFLVEELRRKAEEARMPEPVRRIADQELSLLYHIQVPSGAIQKDGPSTGIMMLAALAALLAGRPARRDAAMTGEITLTGRVFPVGGIREKILAARRARVRTVVVPARNR